MEDRVKVKRLFIISMVSLCVAGVAMLMGLYLVIFGTERNEYNTYTADVSRVNSEIASLDRRVSDINYRLNEIESKSKKKESGDAFSHVIKGRETSEGRFDKYVAKFDFWDCRYIENDMVDDVETLIKNIKELNDKVGTRWRYFYKAN